MKKKRIFLGVNNIASLFNYYKKGYESQGYKVTTCSNHNKFCEMEYDMSLDYFNNILGSKYIYYNLKFDQNSKIKFIPIRFFVFLFIKIFNIFKKVNTFIKILLFVIKYDIFHFIWFSDYPDKIVLFKLIKLFRKKIIINFVGDEVRWRPLLIQEYQILGLHHENFNTFVEQCYTLQNSANEFIKRLQYVRISEKYADILLSVPDQSQLLLRPYHNFFLPIEIPHNKSISNIRKSKVVVMHATTSRYSKGTDKLLVIMDKIQSKYPNLFEFKFVENKSRSEVLELLTETDIVVYSLIGQGPGMFGLETILNKVLLMSGNNETYLKYPTKNMVIDANFDNLEEKLIYYVQNNNERLEIVENAYTNICKHNDMYVVCENIIKQLYDKKNKHIFLHYPTFFRSFASFNTEYDTTSVHKINQWTSFVKNCDWYKEHVPSGERDGLIF